jgi:hypothetical protein
LDFPLLLLLCEAQRVVIAGIVVIAVRFHSAIAHHALGSDLDVKQLRRWRRRHREGTEVCRQQLVGRRREVFKRGLRLGHRDRGPRCWLLRSISLARARHHVIAIFFSLRRDRFGAGGRLDCLDRR